MSRYHVFTRTWWKDAEVPGQWPNDLEPCAGDKHTLGIFITEEAAQDRCRTFNQTHSPGRYDLMAEYTEI